MRGSRRSSARQAIVLVVLAAAGLAACPSPTVRSDVASPGGPDTTSPTPAPTWGPAFLARTTDSARYALLRDSLRAYARTLTYDGADGSGDEQRVMVGSWPNARFGPRLRIEPARGIHKLSDADYLTGRVVGRIVAVSRDSTYAKLGIAVPAADTLLYWFVFRVGGQWRSVVLSERNTGRVMPTDTTVHPPGRWRQEIARFVWEETDDGLWSSCTSMRCCRITQEQYALAQPL